MTALTPEQIEEGKRLLNMARQAAAKYAGLMERGMLVSPAQQHCVVLEEAILTAASEAEALRARVAELEAQAAEWGDAVEGLSELSCDIRIRAEQEAEALRAEVGRLREAVDKTREAFDEVWPFYEGEHYYDHPCSVRVRALIEAADALAMPGAEVGRLRGAALVFKPADEIPNVTPGTCKLFIAAIRRGGRPTVYTVPAYFLNAMPLVMNDGEGCGNCPDDDSHADGCPQTGWHDCKEKDGWDEYFGALLTGNDELVAWAEIPAFTPTPIRGAAAGGSGE